MVFGTPSSEPRAEHFHLFELRCVQGRLLAALLGFVEEVLAAIISTHTLAQRRHGFLRRFRVLMIRIGFRV